MLSYVSYPNIDTRILRKAADILDDGGLIAFPTDTSWSIACSPFSKTGVARLQTLKGTKVFTPTIMCDSLSQFTDFALIDTADFRFMKALVPGPFVFVFKPLHALEKKICMKRSEVGLRIPDHDIPRALVRSFTRPIFALTASRQMMESGWWDKAFAQENLFECGYELEDIPGIDLILDPGEAVEKNLATVISLINGEPEIIRQGLGLVP